MNVVVINTGTELLLGDVVNTHLSFIAREIFPLGLRIARQVTVPDGVAIRDSLLDGFKDAQIIFVTGGLGPTTDDITREITAEVLGLPLRQDAIVVEAITSRLRTRGFPLVDRILRQAEVPEGAAVLPNDNGTAPGLYIEAKTQTAATSPHIFLLPGPPSELHPMFRNSVLPILLRIVPERRSVESRTFRLARVGESMVEAKVGAEILALPGVELGYCARAGEVDVRVIGQRSSLAAAEAAIRRAFPKAIFSTGRETLEEAVVQLLTSRRETLAVAESCTGGYLGHRLTNVPGASAVFVGGYLTYSNDLKSAALGLDTVLIKEHGAVSGAVARAMADAARQRAGSNYALATTGIAGPGGGSTEKPVGTLFVGLASADHETRAERFKFPSDRQTFKQLATQAALDMLRQHVIAQL